MGNLCCKAQTIESPGKGGKGGSNELPSHGGETISVDDSKVFDGSPTNIFYKFSAAITSGFCSRDKV